MVKSYRIDYVYHSGDPARAAAARLRTVVSLHSISLFPELK